MLKDLTNQRFGRLKVMYKSGNRNSFALWHCKCDCGNTTIKTTHGLRSGDCQSCGCIHREMLSRDLTGERFGRLFVEGKSGTDFRGTNIWKCKCDCGKITYLKTNALTSGNTKSCGCLVSDTQRARMIKYNTKYFDEESYILSRKILSMKARCYNPNEPGYKNYGGRGIKICDEWKNDTQKFINWAKSHGFKKGLSIGRIDVNGDYCPENCRFVDMITQSNNRRNNRLITIRKKTRTLAQWARDFGLRPSQFGWLYSEPDHVIVQKLIDRLTEIVVKLGLGNVQDVDEIIRIYSENKDKV